LVWSTVLEKDVRSVVAFLSTEKPQTSSVNKLKFSFAK